VQPFLSLRVITRREFCGLRYLFSLSKEVDTWLKLAVRSEVVPYDGRIIDPLPPKRTGMTLPLL
jgi:hypothetical protein